jgi:hypothetical protein
LQGKPRGFGGKDRNSAETPELAPCAKSLYLLEMHLKSISWVIYGEGGIEIALKTKTLQFVDEVDTPKNTLVESPLCAFMQHSSLRLAPVIARCPGASYSAP